MSKASAISAALVAVAGSAGAITIHRSFRTEDVGFGANAGVSVPVERRVSEAIERHAAEEAEKRLKIVGRVTRVDGANILYVTPNGGIRRRVILEGVAVDGMDGEKLSALTALLKDVVYRKTVEVHYRLKLTDGSIVGLVRVKNGKSGWIDVNATLVAAAS